MVRCLMLDLISAYENYLTKVKQASANTVFAYLRDVRQFAAWLQEQEETNVVDAITFLLGNNAQSTNAKHDYSADNRGWKPAQKGVHPKQ